MDLTACKQCGISEPTSSLVDGVCEECLAPEEPKPKEFDVENRFLLMGFWEFGIIATLVVAFFPWSLLFSLFFLGMEGTKLLIAALLHDGLKTIGAVLLIAMIVVAILLIAIIVILPLLISIIALT